MTTPPRPPLHQLLWTISLLGWWSSSGSDRGITHFFQATRNTTKGVGEKKTKNKRTIWLGSTQVQEGQVVTVHSLCICRLTLACTLREISTSHEECWLILTGLPSPLLDSISCDWFLRCPVSTANCYSASPVANSFLWVPSSNSSLVFPCLLPVSGRSRF